MSSLQQRVGSSLSLVVELLFYKRRHLCCLSMFPDSQGHLSPIEANITTGHCQSSEHLAPTERGHCPQGVRRSTHRRVSHTASKVAMLIYFSISYILKVFFFFFFPTLSKEQTKENILFPGLGYCLWFIFHCFEKTCSSRFSYCSGHSLGSSVHTLGSSSSTFSKLPGLERQW